MAKKNQQNEETNVETEEKEETLEEQTEDELATDDSSEATSEADEEPPQDEEKDEEKDETQLLQERVNQLQEKTTESEDKFRRLYAEFENYKRRSKQESQSLIKFAQQPLAVSILPGLDNLDRALQHAREEDDGQNAEFIKGVEMVFNELHEALKKHNITRIDAKGKKFDPNLHEAVGVVPSEDVKPDHVVNVFQAGYLLHDRVIRPAMVQVAKK